MIRNLLTNQNYILMDKQNHIEVSKVVMEVRIAKTEQKDKTKRTLNLNTKGTKYNHLRMK